MDIIDDLWRQHRSYLVDLAFRMVGNIQDAEDIVQEAFTRLLGADIGGIEEVRGWLVVVVGRLCIDQLRSARSRRDANVPTLDDRLSPASQPIGADPADRVTLDDSVRVALAVVLEQLSPAERAVFVLHDVFQFTFEAVSTIVGRTPAACRQIASRARRRIQAETGPGRFTVDTGEQHHVAEEFIAACAGGDMAALMRVLDPDVAGDADLPPGVPRRPQHGRVAVSRGLMNYLGPRTETTLVSQPVNGRPGALAFRDRKLWGILVFKVREGLIYDIHAIIDPAKLALVSYR
jgi:RNA polymerase sigma-70 factor (ECF subfamily)